jgi:hypothetical protein
MINFEELEIRSVYKVNGRNFKIAVYCGNQHFIGIRNKFGYDRLDGEYFGHSISLIEEKIGEIKDQHIVLQESLEFSFCGYCGANIIFNPEKKCQEHLVPTKCKEVLAYSNPNYILKQELEDIINEYSSSGDC